jgi:hypothetical protein
VDATEALVDAVETDEAGGVVDALLVPDPEVELVQPARAAPATSTNTVSCEQRRIIGLSSSVSS